MAFSFVHYILPTSIVYTSGMAFPFRSYKLPTSIVYTSGVAFYSYRYTWYIIYFRVGISCKTHIPLVQMYLLHVFFVFFHLMFLLLSFHICTTQLRARLILYPTNHTYVPFTRQTRATERQNDRPSDRTNHRVTPHTPHTLRTGARTENVS